MLIMKAKHVTQTDDIVVKAIMKTLQNFSPRYLRVCRGRGQLDWGIAVSVHPCERVAIRLKCSLVQN